ncbi:MULTISPECIES: glycosyltransferase family 9 protein [unclassified Methylophaga]|jgi:ADP-heptose:LPS heptosyltransferase|uniref:glycosyltransferase family 9 protein n=1 Tax=unclassified Methylophaga TaxID=2629249 RepID=UPI000C3A99E6|nr:MULTISPECIES: glycosyltransferase family 9 protein [unclassified Methylophaga]MAM29047.1 glycosyl transferase [Flavobacteriaceae bacterium]MAL50722.1 glycosyl transferase [Methylophaga sp.]MBP23983.1 glycosyl transferase [Methylophaga sp.]HAD32658.1 glycosyltransferase family 9 protein [Methylophaga sp.]HCC80799.1 glycosyltransferase family 9 protein [Methylophaga sp.]|tara:strand:+ start:6818 stop:7720 length:903 start_codon:yes stop_codon:yes gene_type:complete
MKSPHILVIKHGAFGDLLQADGVLHDIRVYFDHARISLLTSSAYQLLMQRSPHIDFVLTDKRWPLWRVSDWWLLRKTLREQDFDLVIDLQNTQRTRLYRKLLLPRSPWVQRATKHTPVSGLQGQIELLQQAGIDSQYARQADLRWLADDMQQWLTECEINSGFILLLPGCSARRPEKRWPFYPQLAETLATKGINVVTVLGPDESQLAEQFNGKLLKDLNWFQLAGVIQQAGFVIGNDSGPSHLAAHLGKAGMAIFGPHSCAQRAEIERKQFKPYSISSLSELNVETIIAYLQAQGVVSS